MNRFEVHAARVVGIGLPIVEMLRRRTDFSDLPAYLDDFIWGGLLLWAAWAVLRRRWYGDGLLIAAWAVLCGAMYYSFFGQVTHPHPRDVSGLPSRWVAAAKGAFLLFVLFCLIRSIRHGRPSQPTQ